MVGFVALFGMAARNTILLVSHYDHLVAEEGETWNLATALRGAEERLTPVLLTAATDRARAAAGRVQAHQPGHENRRADGDRNPGRAGFVDRSSACC
jgi:hypothetical protein